MRVDVEVGYTLIEVKKDLRVGRVLADAEVQLAGYVHTRTLLAARRRVAAPGKVPGSTSRRPGAGEHRDRGLRGVVTAPVGVRGCRPGW
jgi:hypothetical protein